MTIQSHHHWCLILAAGSGTRLSSLTTDASGETVPKQFCSLNGGPSLLRRTLTRAFRIAPWSRTALVMASEHRHHWQDALPEIPGANIIEQPLNRGTAIGILLLVLHVLQRDPAAEVVLLPSDHHIDNEEIFADAIIQALNCVGDGITLLGIEPDGPDQELGYIVCNDVAGIGHASVSHFVEKPVLATAERLIAEGALWNSFVIVARAKRLLTLIAERFPDIVTILEDAIVAEGSPDSLVEAYRRLPALDFSRDVITPSRQPLTCVRVPPCGWTDLGTPHRVAECLSRLNTQNGSAQEYRPSPDVVDLAEAYRRRQIRTQIVYPTEETAQLIGELS